MQRKTEVTFYNQRVYIFARESDQGFPGHTRDKFSHADTDLTDLSGTCGDKDISDVITGIMPY